MHESSKFVELLILFGSVTGVATLCHYLKLPTIVGFIFAGLLIGPSGLSLVPTLPAADAIAEGAIILLMFTIGLEFSFKKLMQLKREFLQLGLVQVALTIILVMMAAQLIGDMPLNKSIFLGFLVSLSSTALVMKLLQDARDVETPYGRFSLSILLFQDLAVIPMMLALPLLANQAGDDLPVFNAKNAALAVFKMAGIMLALWGAARYFIPFVLERVVKTKSREIFFFGMLFFCLFIAWLFELSGLSLSLGAFAAGIMLSEGPYGRQVAADIIPLRDNFLGFFFTSIGMLIDVQFMASHILPILGIGILLFVIKSFVVLIASLFNRAPISMAVMVALILAQIGEFSFILASRGVDLGILTHQENQYFLAVSVLSMIFTPFLYKAAPRVAMGSVFTKWRSIGTLKEASKVRKKLKHENEAAGTIIIGYGIAGQNMAAAMDALHIHYKICELNYEVVKKQRRAGLPIHFGDATRKDVLEHLGIEEARLVVIAVSGAKIVPAIIATVRQLRPDVQIIVRVQYVRDAEAIPREPNTDLVVAEIETAVELLARALKVYGVESDAIRDYMTHTHQQLNTFAHMTSTLRSPTLNLPSWEALSSIKPYRIGDSYAAVDRSLASLELPRATGVAVVSVYREGLGTTIPGGDFVFKEGDVAHLIGSPDALRAAGKILKEGRPTST